MELKLCENSDTTNVFAHLFSRADTIGEENLGEGSIIIFLKFELRIAANEGPPHPRFFFLIYLKNIERYYMSLKNFDNFMPFVQMRSSEKGILYFNASEDTSFVILDFKKKKYFVVYG